MLTTQSSRPRVVLRGSKVGRSSFTLLEPDEIVRRVGERLFAAFLKCFVGMDRLLTLEQLLALSFKHVEKDSVPYDRNLRVLVQLLAGTMYEIGKALQELCNARVVEKMNNRSPWSRVNEVRGRWMGDARLATIRNQMAHHLGDSEVYDLGLRGVLARGDHEVAFERGDGRFRYGSDCPLAWDALLGGLPLSLEEFTAVAALTQQGHHALPGQLVAVFAEVLRTAGVDVVDESIATAPQGGPAGSPA